MKFDIEGVLRIVAANGGSEQIFPERPPRVARNFFEDDGTRERADSSETLVHIQPCEMAQAN